MLNGKLAALVAMGAIAALAAAAPAEAQIAPRPVEVYSHMPLAEPGDDPANWSARRNVVDSERYERLVHTSPAFRAARIQKECGEITEPGLFQQCVDAFNQ
jgi:hypothetical protein